MYHTQRLNKHYWLEVHRTMDEKAYFGLIVNKHNMTIYETGYCDSKREAVNDCKNWLKERESHV